MDPRTTQREMSPGHFFFLQIHSIDIPCYNFTPALHFLSLRTIKKSDLAINLPSGKNYEQRRCSRTPPGRFLSASKDSTNKSGNIGNSFRRLSKISIDRVVYVVRMPISGIGLVYPSVPSTSHSFTDQSRSYIISWLSTLARPCAT